MPDDKRAAHTRRRYMRRINAARIVGRSVNPDKTQWVTAIASFASNGVPTRNSGLFPQGNRTLLRTWQRIKACDRSRESITHTRKL
jgi:hypothetical protein